MWLDSFFSKYDTSPAYHFTLKNATYIEYHSKSWIINKIEKLAQEFTTFEIKLDRVFHSATKRGECIMVSVVESEGLRYLRDIQKEILEVFGNVGKHIKPAYSTYEMNFNPHLTIARYLDPLKFREAWAEIERNQLRADCGVVINRIVAIFAQADDKQEIEQTAEFIEFKLKKDRL